jgi:hypothetical protein
MNRVPVESTRIASVGYDLQSQMLEIEIKSRQPHKYASRIYRYYGVPSKIYTTFMALPDKGFYFEYTIKGAYDYEEVTGESE